MAAQSRNIYFPLQSQDPSPYSTQSCMKWDFFQAVWREQALFLTLHMQQWLLPLNFRKVLLSIRCPHTYILINIQLNAQGEGFIDFWSHMSVYLPLVQHSLLWIDNILTFPRFSAASPQFKESSNFAWFLPPYPMTLKLSQDSMLG